MSIRLFIIDNKNNERQVVFCGDGMESPLLDFPKTMESRDFASMYADENSKYYKLEFYNDLFGLVSNIFDMDFLRVEH